MSTRTVEVRLKATVADFRAGMASAGASVDELQAKLASTDAKTKANVQAVSRGMLLIGGAAVTGVGFAVKAFADFDKAMSNVKAVSNAGAGAMGDLRDAALKAGAETVFSATEAATAEAELARAGVETSDILSGGLRGSLDLATAGQLDLGDAAIIAAQAMNVFKLEGEDVAHIADVLAAGSNKSAADVKSLGDALRQGGGVAAQMGAGLEETVGTLSAFADNALIGSDAGTSFKTMLQRLNPQSKEAADAMELIGLNAYDTQGNFVGLDEVAGQLQTGLGTLTQKQRDSTLATIFGADAVRAANVLYEQGESGIRTYTDAVDDQGAASRNAATQLDNLAGDVEAFRGSLETAFIKSGSSANGFARTAVNGATDVVNAYSDLPGVVQGTVTAVAGVGGALVAGLGGVGLIIPKVQESRKALRELGTAGATADRQLGRLGKLGAYGAAAATAAIGFEILTDQINELTGNGPADIERLTNSLLKVGDAGEATGEAARLFGDDLGGVNVAVRDATKPLADLQSGFGLLPSRVDTARDKLSAIDDVLAGLVRGGNAEQAADLFNRLAENLPRDKVDDFRNSLDGYGDALAGADTEATLAADSTGEFADSVDDVSPVVEDATDAVEGYKDALDNLNGVNIDAARAQLDLAGAYKDANKASEKGKTVTDDETSALLDLASQANDTAKAVLDQTGSQQKSNGVLREARERFYDTARAMGYTKGEANNLRDAWLGIPTRRQTKYTATGVEGAQTELARLRDTILGIPTKRSVAVTVTTVNKIGASPEIQGRRAAGGLVRAGELYQVNELGVELFRPAVDGTVVPANLTGALLSGSPSAVGGGYGGGTSTNSRHIELTVHTHEGESVIDALPRSLDALMWKVDG